MRIVAAVVWVLVSGTTLSAQARPDAAPATSPGLFVDGVMATVNDSAIMVSSIKVLAASRLRELRQRGVEVTRSDWEDILKEYLDREINRHRMAQAAKSLGALPPEQIDEIVRDELARDQQEQVRAVGTYNGFSRELRRQGSDWPTRAAEQRIDKLKALADEIAVFQRLEKKHNLFLTPRMLRETWANPQHRAHFKHDAAARVVQVRFDGPDAEKSAAAAATAWRQEDVTARALAERFPGAIAIGEVTVSEMAVAMAPVVQFALAGPAGAVSPPLAIGVAFHVAKVTQYLPARDGKFEDQDVQDELREICYRAVLEEFRKQAIDRAVQRTEVWVPQAPRQ